MPTCSGWHPVRHSKVQIEGIHYELDWKNFSVGSSFFIPCINDAAARECIERKMRRLKYNIVIKLVIEDGIRGLRVWRVSRYNKHATSVAISL